MKTALDLLRQAIEPKQISACVSDLIGKQTLERRSLAEPHFVNSVRELEALCRLVARGLVRVLP